MLTRDEVLDVLEGLSPLKRKKLDRKDVPVLFMKNNRIAVVLPGDRYTQDEMIKLDGKFQNRMTLAKGVHAFLDFSPEDGWRGLETPLRAGFN